MLQLMTRSCPYCEGRSYIKDNVTICHEIYREIQRVSGTTRHRKIEVKAHQDIVDLLLDEERDVLLKLEKTVRRRIYPKVDATFHHERFEIRTHR